MSAFFFLYSQFLQSTVLSISHNLWRWMAISKSKKKKKNDAGKMTQWVRALVYCWKKLYKFLFSPFYLSFPLSPSHGSQHRKEFKIKEEVQFVLNIQNYLPSGLVDSYKSWLIPKL